MMYDGYGWGWGGSIVMGVLIVLFWAGVITMIVLAIRYLAGGGQATSAGDRTLRSGEDILAERFARGEIDDEEYRRRMSLLREHRAPR